MWKSFHNAHQYTVFPNFGEDRCFATQEMAMEYADNKLKSFDHIVLLTAEQAEKLLPLL